MLNDSDHDVERRKLMMVRDDFEDEEKNKEEEEKKKADDEAAAAPPAAASDPVDEWGQFATVGKKKKGKKEPDPPPPPPVETVDLGASATADAEDEWGFGTKKKKGKKGKVSNFFYFSSFREATNPTVQREQQAGRMMRSWCGYTDSCSVQLPAPWFRGVSSITPANRKPTRTPQRGKELCWLLA